MRKLLSAVLSVIMLLSLCVPAFAAGSCDCGNSPVIYIRGFGGALYYADGDGTKTAFPMSSETIMLAAPDILKAAAGLAVNDGYRIFADGAMGAISAICGDLACDENGDSLCNLSARCELPDEDIHQNTAYGFQGRPTGETGEYRFDYDWRLDPLDNAGQLNDYINAVLDITGHSKVILVAHSEGNNVVCSYLYRFGSSKVEKTLFLSGAYQGMTLANDLFTMNVGVGDRGAALVEFIRTFLGTAPAGSAAASLLSMLESAGLLDALLPVFQDVLDAQLDRMYENCIIPLFAYMPGLWSFVSGDSYEQAKQTMLGSVNGALVERIDEYHYNVQQRLDKILAQAEADGMAIVITSGYGISQIPVVEDTSKQCDMLIDTANTSIGATCPAVGSTLGYTGEYVSADGMVDASTCLYPEYTWFFKQQSHNDFCEAYVDFLNWAITFDGQPTVASDTAYPQFLVCTRHESLVPVEADDGQNSSDIVVFFSSLFALIKQLFAKIIACITSLSF